MTKIYVYQATRSIYPSALSGKLLVLQIAHQSILIFTGCGPLPMSDGLSWSTESGRSLHVNSTVYEVYSPRCSQNGVLNRNLHSVRCGEDLNWTVSIQGLRCLYGTNSILCSESPFPLIFVYVLIYDTFDFYRLWTFPNFFEMEAAERKRSWK